MRVLMLCDLCIQLCIQHLYGFIVDDSTCLLSIEGGYRGIVLSASEKAAI